MAHSDHDHHRGHGHAHGHSLAERRVFGVMLLTAGFALVEAFGGWVSGSLALLADAGHMFTDSLALGLAWLGFLAARRRADLLRTYGYLRYEVLAAWANGVLLLGLIVWLAVEAVQRLLDPQPVEAGTMLVVALMGLAVNAVALRILHQGEHENLNLRAATLHVIGDLLGSVGAVAAAIIILATGWTYVDPILSLLVGVLILRSAWLLVKESTHILLEGTPEGLDVEALRTTLTTAVEGLEDVHHVHAWSLTSGRPLITFHARIAPDRDPGELLERVKHLLDQDFAISHSVVQIETGTCPDQDH